MWYVAEQIVVVAKQYIIGPNTSAKSSNLWICSVSIRNTLSLDDKTLSVAV